MSSYVIGDVHGCYNALMKLLDKLKLSEDDVVYFVGDWVDRALTESQQIKTLEWFNRNVDRDGKFRSVVGNHDCDFNEKMQYSGLEQAIVGEFVEKVNKLPVYYVVERGEQIDVITHSWVCGQDGRTLSLNSLNRVSLQLSIWDRRYSVYFDPEAFRVIHGHTIVTSNAVDNMHKIVDVTNRIVKFNDNNIDIDCGCFTGVQSGGNLAAFRLEDSQEFYAYDEEDVRARCELLSELTEGKVQPCDILFLFNPYGKRVFNVELDWVQEYKRQFSEMHKEGFISFVRKMEAFNLLSKVSIDGEKIFLWV